VHVQARDGIRSHCFSLQDKIGPMDQNPLVLHFFNIFHAIFGSLLSKKKTISSLSVKKLFSLEIRERFIFGIFLCGKLGSSTDLR